jgi:hypothetical protein
MIRLSALALVLVLVSAVSADAKSRTLKVALVDDSAQLRPIEVSGPAVAVFGVWDGPGVRINGEPQMEGFIADWRTDPAGKRPEGLRPFRVSFYTGCVPGERILGCSVPEERLSYVVIYEYDSTSNIGYVYLPGKGEDGYDVNTRSILRGVEGRWFMATAEWRDYIAPLIVRAMSPGNR